MVPRKLVLASPRGYCAGVDRAVDTVERALDHFGAPVYVRKEIVHNRHVVRELADRGAVFVDSELDVPEGGAVVLSAHGVAPEVYRNSKTRGLRVLDATCPLVSKVHAEARRYAARGYTRGTLAATDREIAAAHRGAFAPLRRFLRANC